MSSTSIKSAMQKELMLHYPAEAAVLLEQISAEDAAQMLGSHSSDVASSVMSYISPHSVIRIIDKIESGLVSTLLNHMPANKLAMVIAFLDDTQKASYLQKINADLSDEILEILHYPDNTAGSIMDMKLAIYRPSMSVKETLSRFRQSKKGGRRVIFLTGDDRKLHGYVEIQDILMVSPETRLSELAKPITHFANDTSLREEVVEILEASKMSELPVINLNGEMVGVIRYSALVQATKEDATADIQIMVGASKDERALSKISFAVRKRLPWLEINLITAFLAASVVGMFESTIAQYTALAILLPVVAGQSGNTGAQALAVTMRGLALREIRPKHWPKILFKEANVGLINGIAVALTTALGVYLWSKSFGLSLIICMSMIISMVLASVAGASVPIVLAKLGQDPAQSSSIILTTITDVVGFFSFLGIATALIGLL